MNVFRNLLFQSHSTANLLQFDEKNFRHVNNRCWLVYGSSIGKHRVKKRTRLRRQFCFHIFKNMAQNNKQEKNPKKFHIQEMEIFKVVGFCRLEAELSKRQKLTSKGRKNKLSRYFSLFDKSTLKIVGFEIFWESLLNPVPRSAIKWLRKPD